MDFDGIDNFSGTGSANIVGISVGNGDGIGIRSGAGTEVAVGLGLVLGSRIGLESGLELELGLGPTGTGTGTGIRTGIGTGIIIRIGTGSRACDCRNSAPFDILRFCFFFVAATWRWRSVRLLSRTQPARRLLQGVSGYIPV